MVSYFVVLNVPVVLLCVHSYLKHKWVRITVTYIYLGFIKIASIFLDTCFPDKEYSRIKKLSQKSVSFGSKLTLAMEIEHEWKKTFCLLEVGVTSYWQAWKKTRFKLLFLGIYFFLYSFFYF